MGAPTNPAFVKKVLANSEPSTHEGQADSICSQRAFPVLTQSGLDQVTNAEDPWA